MKILTRILFLSLLITGFAFSEEEEEIRTIDKDGMIYKINNSSLHITPYDDDNAIMKSSEDTKNIQLVKSAESKSCGKGCLKACCSSSGCDLTFSIGTVATMGNDDYDPGNSISILMPTGWSFDLFKKTWSVSGEMNITSLAGITGEDANILAGIAHFDPSFDLPLDVTFGVGIAKSDQLGGLSGTGLVDVSYKLPYDKCDLSLGFRYQKMVDVSNADGIELDFGLLDTFGFNIKCNKSF